MDEPLAKRVKCVAVASEKALPAEVLNGGNLGLDEPLAKEATSVAVASALTFAIPAEVLSGKVLSRSFL